MNEQSQNPNPDENEVNAADEMQALKERARILGITFGNNISLEGLRKRVNDKINGLPDEPEEKPAVAAVQSAEPVVREKTAAEKEAELRDALVKESLALIRCKIYNLNPDKRDLKGEIITVANRYIGKVSKFIPFGEETENGYHIPKVLFDDLSARQYQDIRTREENGKTIITRRMAPEFNLVVLPALTAEELAELALKQETAARMGA